MFIELTDRINNRKFSINTERIEIVDDADGCQIWMVGSTNSIDPVESYADVVSMLAPRREETDQNVIEVLEAVTEHLEDIGTQYQKEIVRAALEKARQ